MKRQVQADEKVKEQETSRRSSYGSEDRKENSVKRGFQLFLAWNLRGVTTAGRLESFKYLKVSSEVENVTSVQGLDQR